MTNTYKLLGALVLMFCTHSIYAQNVGIGTATPTEKLHVQGGARVTSLSGVSNRLVFSTATGVLTNLADGTAAGQVLTTDGAGNYSWGTATAGWELLGNAGTNPTINFVGTTDAQDLVFRTNSIENMRINLNGNVGIGTTSDIARLYTYVPSTDATTNYGIYQYFDGADNGSTYGIRNFNYGAGNGLKYGIYSNVNSEGTGGRYGFYNFVTLNSASNSSASGIRNYLYTFGTGTQYGIFNYVSSTSATGIHYGQRNYVYLASTNTSNAFGEHTTVDYSSGNRYGEYKSMNSNSTYDGNVYGDYNQLFGTGDGVNYAVYNSLQASGTGVKYGVYNNMSASDGTKYGVRNEFTDVAGMKFGVYNNFPSGTATGTIYGTYNNIQADGNATKYGAYTNISGGDGALRGYYSTITAAVTNTSTLYGVYSNVNSNGTGTHYGGYFSAYGDNNRAVFATNSHATGWAGYFVGNFYADGNTIFNESGTNDHDFRVESDTRTHAFWVDASTDIVNFGSSLATATDNGATIAGSTVQYVADFDLGGAVWDGTAIGIGSIEYLLDGVAITLINNGFGPTTHIAEDLGTAAAAWDDVYADDYWTISDVRKKQNITEMKYGLKEILALETISYTLIDDQFQSPKIGLKAQQALTLIPEAVKAYDHKILDETKPDVYTKVELEHLSMSYQTIVPVLIKGMQEQQAQIELLKEEVRLLKEEKE